SRCYSLFLASGARKNALDNRQRTAVNRAGMSKKTIVILLVGLVLGSVRLAEGQQSKKIAHIGLLSNGGTSLISPLTDAFVRTTLFAVPSHSLSARTHCALKQN